MGTEIEYGISVQGQPHANPMVACSQVVNAYASATIKARRARWDFEEESPLRDARGFDLSRQLADPSQLTDEDLGLANVILTNGARLYVDHAHPEYSTPEVTTPLDVVLWDKAGEQVMLDAARMAAQTPGTAPINLYKNNTDNKGASYGAHENYLMSRATPFSDIVRHLTPFFVSRQVFTGSGRVGIGQDGREHGFQISQRADYFEVEVGLETTLKRPIINTRDEPHADPEKYRRLHVIIGDANMSEYALYLKLGATALVLAMIEDEFLPRTFTLRDPVATLKGVSRDLTCRKPMQLDDGSTISPIALQWEYWAAAERYCATFSVEPWGLDVLQKWAYVLYHLEQDPLSLDRELDWVIKWRLLTSYMDRHGYDWDSAQVTMLDLQYHDIRRDKGLYYVLERSGKVERIVTDAEIDLAVDEPPGDTRAYLRGMCLKKFRQQVFSVNWDSLAFNLDAGDIRRIALDDPLQGTKAQVANAIEGATSAAELLATLFGT
jgi:Pup amidohydrolase